MFWNWHLLHFCKCYQALILPCIHKPCWSTCSQDSSEQQQEVPTGTTRPRRVLGEEEKQRLSEEICNSILTHTKERFSFSALVLYQVLQRYNLQEILSETAALLNILITTPMTTAEAERRFSTLKRIKTFLRNAVGHERLNWPGSPRPSNSTVIKYVFQIIFFYRGFYKLQVKTGKFPIRRCQSA